MIPEVASLLAVVTLCAIMGWAVVYLAAKFQNRKPEISPARLWALTVASRDKKAGRRKCAPNSATESLVDHSNVPDAGLPRPTFA